MEKRFFFQIQYLGTPYAGWQKQPNAFTVQECVEKTIVAKINQKTNVVAAGRTDAGVHALGQMIHFDLATKLPVKAVKEKINRGLPGSIYFKKGWITNTHWHAIKSAKWKHYRYIIYRHNFRSPLYDDRSWVFDFPLDVFAMERASKHFVGDHDFSSFMASDGMSQTFHRSLQKCKVTEKKDWIIIDLIGNGFLKNMVRNIVGTLIDVGLKRLKSEQIPSILKAKDRRKAGRGAPAHGLYLMHVHYPQELYSG